MWEKAELARLFATPIWTGRLSEQRRTTLGSPILRDKKFWLPLITVFSGLRLEEICQLYGVDIKRHEGISFFDIDLTGWLWIGLIERISDVPPSLWSGVSASFPVS